MDVSGFIRGCMPVRWAVVLAVLFCAVVGSASWPRTGVAAPGPTNRLIPGDVTTYLYGLDRTSFTSDAAINPRSVRLLKERVHVTIGQSHATLYGTTAYTNTIISAQPVIAGDRIFWGTWDGNEQATSTRDGHTFWRTQLGVTRLPTCDPPVLGVSSTPAVTQMTLHGTQRLVLFLGGGDGALYALDAGNGAVLWRTPLGAPRLGYYLWSSPAVYKGSVYMGVSSVGDCPAVHGQLVKVDAATGAIQTIFHTVAADCTGGSVWGSPTIDAAGNALYIATGNSGPCDSTNASGKQYEYAPAVVELRLSDLALLGVWTVPAKQQTTDSDFGSTPTLFTAKYGGRMHRMVGAVNKNGIYYAFERDMISKGPVWQTQPLSYIGGTIAPAAWDGTHLYAAAYNTTIRGVACKGNYGNVRALDPATGKMIWQDCLYGGPAFAPVTAVPGVVFAAIGSHLYGLDPATGNEYFSYQNVSSNWFYAPPVVAHGVLYAANTEGKIYAFSPGGA